MFPVNQYKRFYDFLTEHRLEVFEERDDAKLYIVGTLLWLSELERSSQLFGI